MDLSTFILNIGKILLKDINKKCRLDIILNLFKDNVFIFLSIIIILYSKGAGLIYFIESKISYNFLTLSSKLKSFVNELFSKSFNNLDFIKNN